MFYWVAKNTKFPAGKGRFDKTDPHCSVALSKSNVFLLTHCKLKDKFHCKESIIIHGVSACERAQTKEKSNFHFQKYLRPLTREFPLTRICK